MYVQAVPNYGIYGTDSGYCESDLVGIISGNKNNGSYAAIIRCSRNINYGYGTNFDFIYSMVLFDKMSNNQTYPIMLYLSFEQCNTYYIHIL
jgi:hypothetical protein